MKEIRAINFHIWSQNLKLHANKIIILNLFNPINYFLYPTSQLNIYIIKDYLLNPIIAIATLQRIGSYPSPLGQNVV